MRADLAIELVGDDVDQLYRLWRGIVNSEYPGLGDGVFGSPFRRWVAEITGPDKTYRLARTFLRPRKDYTKANSKGSRGVFAHYILESGKLYEVCKARHRYFCYVNESGDIVEAKREEVDAWIKGRWGSMSTMPPSNE